MYKKSLVIGIDHGNRFTKSKEGMYTSGFTVSRTLPVGFDNVLKYENKYYIVGENRKKYMYDKTIDDSFFILSLPSISMIMDTENISEADIILGVGLPLSHFKLKEKFINYFKRNEVKFRYNNKNYFIDIKEVMCFPQALAGFMLSYNKYISEGIDFLNLIDIGQVTIDAVKIDNGKPLINTAISLNFGMLKLIKNIQENIRKETGIDITEQQIETSLQGKKALFFNNQIDRIIENTKNGFLNEMFGELKENGFELEATANILMGGGGILVHKILQEGKHDHRIGYYDILPNSQKANALGYEMLVHQALKRR